MADPALTSQSRLLQLPAEIKAKIFESIDHAPSQVMFALSCKAGADIAAGRDLNLAVIEPEDPKCSNSSQFPDANPYFLDMFAQLDWSKYNDPRAMVSHYTAHRATPELRDGLFSDLPELMKLLGSTMPDTLKLCNHCMTYRPKNGAYWDAKPERLTMSKTWRLQRFVVNHGGPARADTASGKPPTKRLEEKCPFCFFVVCGYPRRTISCPGCRMQAEARLRNKGEY